MIKLRQYQQKLIDDINQAWTKARSLLMILPTGGGKTVIFSTIMRKHKGTSAAVVHRKEIIAQISISLAQLDVKHRIIAPPQVVALIRRKHLKLFSKSFIDPHARSGVISVQTLTSAASQRNSEIRRWINQITLCVFDEGHHYVKNGLWSIAVDMMNSAKLLFVTATIERADGKGLGRQADGFVDKIIDGPSMQWLIDNKYLCQFSYKAPSTDLDLEGLAVTASGDFSSQALRKRVVKSHLVGDVVEQYKQFARNTRTIVFATDVQTAKEIADTFNVANISAVALSGKIDHATREQELDRFERGDVRVLVNVDLFDEGFDVPAVETIILARPTESLAKFLQMIGRGLRIIAGKNEAIIIDPVRNWERHGMPNWPRKWTLENRGAKKSDNRDNMIKQRVCTSCTQPYEMYLMICPYCGHAPKFSGRKTLEKIEGDLIDLDVDAMTALFTRIRHADMNDDDYAINQIARRIPAIGRSHDMKRHRESKYRRTILKELVGWWIGMQPAARTMREKHRRFYHRFSVDIGSAFALKSKETDMLINCIIEKFNDDLY